MEVLLLLQLALNDFKIIADGHIRAVSHSSSLCLFGLLGVLYKMLSEALKDGKGKVSQSSSLKSICVSTKHHHSETVRRSGDQNIA